MLSRFLTRNKEIINKQFFSRLFSGSTFPILEDIKKESNSLHSLLSDVANGDKYLANKQYTTALSSYSMAKDIVMKYSKENNFQAQSILRKMISCCDQTDSTNITNLFENLLKITPNEDKYLPVYLLNYINYGYYLVDTNNYQGVSKLIKNHSLPSEINNKSELLPFQYHYENIKGIMNYQQSNTYKNEIDRKNVSDKLWNLRFRRNEEIMNCDAKQLDEISEEYYNKSNNDVNLIEEIVLYHYSYLSIILQNQTSDKNILREYQRISLKCLGIVDNTPFEFSRYISGLLCEIAKVAHMQEQAVSSEGLYNKAMEIINSIPRIDNNIYWDIYGLLYKDWMNREKNGDRLVKEGFDLLQKHNVNESNRFYKKNWYDWSI